MCTCYLVRSHGNYAVHVKHVLCHFHKPNITVKKFLMSLFLFYEKIHCVIGLR